MFNSFYRWILKFFTVTKRFVILKGHSWIQNYLKTVTYHLKVTNPYIYIYISESEKDYEDSSEFLESHSQSDFSESNDEPVIKPNPLPQPKTGASNKTKWQWKKQRHWRHSLVFNANFEHGSSRILVFILLTLNK